MSLTEYDEVSNARFVTDANQNKVGYEYDVRNLKIEDDRPGTSGAHARSSSFLR